MDSARLSPYAPKDQLGFANLVMDVHAEFGFAYDPDLDADLDDPEAHYRFILLVKTQDTVVGSAALTKPRDEITTLKRMYLRPALRGQGWGLRLLEAMVERATVDGCRGIALDTTDRQDAARRLYERAGFQQHHKIDETVYYFKKLSRT